MFTSAPKHPKSWCIHTPLNLRFLPLSQNPVSLSNLKYLYPYLVSKECQIAPPTFTYVFNVYKFPSYSSHKVGLFICILFVTELLPTDKVTSVVFDFTKELLKYISFTKFTVLAVVELIFTSIFVFATFVFTSVSSVGVVILISFIPISTSFADTK